jgi:prefoldin subunit 5
MELPNDWLGALVTASIIIVLAIANYIRTKSGSPDNSKLVTSFGLGYAEREQVERLIAEVKRIADALTDKNTEGINHRLDDLLERMKHAEQRTHMQKPRAPPR